jgi:hypothetical protein
MPKLKAWSRYYGVSVDEKYSKIKHEAADLRFDPITRTYVAGGQLLWLINKGDVISSDPNSAARGEYSFNFMFPATQERRGAIRLYSYEYDDPPERISEALQGKILRLLRSGDSNISSRSSTSERSQMEPDEL